jgi:hypothetical protein
VLHQKLLYFSTEGLWLTEQEINKENKTTGMVWVVVPSVIPSIPPPLLTSILVVGEARLGDIVNQHGPEGQPQMPKG